MTVTKPALTLAVTTIVLAALPVTAWAENALAALDTNGDGVIGRQEAVSAQVESFRRLDENEDGQISLDELEAGQATPESEQPPRDVQRARDKARERWFKNLDRDQSDGISLSEYQSAMTPYFDRLDADSNGVLDGPELKRAIGMDDADR
ncbi:putative signal transduction protein with EFhand domain-containing protein [Salinisphaera dokdonensis CL-ES53]|uniref:Signal transduction protein with EFhand domain-containing protein n=1 Tax=Salinisphaera dokdonensis CL-ES53 TaxID=1304272 RepID=A0ABV2AVK7_9GAMM